MEAPDPKPEVYFVAALMAYCNKYQRSIFIRAKRGERWANVCLADASGAELLERMSVWAERQFIPVRVLAEGEPEGAGS